MSGIAGEENSGTFDKQGRRRLSVGQVASRLDLRLHGPEVNSEALDAGCHLAIDHGVAAVTCRPEHVRRAAAWLAGTDVSVATGLGFNRPISGAVDESELVTEALQLADLGANEVAVIVRAANLAPCSEASLYRAVGRLEALHPMKGVRVRVHLDPSGLTDEQVVAACRRFAELGVWMVQAGSWRGPKAGYRHVLLMREALGRAVLLKWTNPVSSLHMMLLAIAEGVDRFNADVEVVLREAGRQASYAPLFVPLRGLDF